LVVQNTLKRFVVDRYEIIKTEVGFSNVKKPAGTLHPLICV
jgi:hypothetical protein